MIQLLHYSEQPSATRKLVEKQANEIKKLKEEVKNLKKENERLKKEVKNANRRTARAKKKTPKPWQHEKTRPRLPACRKLWSKLSKKAKQERILMLDEYIEALFAPTKGLSNETQPDKGTNYCCSIHW